MDVETRTEIRRTRFEVDSLLHKVRKEILDLRRNASNNFVEDLVARAQSIVPEGMLHFDCEEVALPQSKSDELLSITSEILRNSYAHARATRIDIRLFHINNLICLEIADDGIGGAHVKSQRFGLPGIQERVKQIQGTIHIDSPDMKGTRIAIAI
jgi:signal transduction histidine kinase